MGCNPFDNTPIWPLFLVYPFSKSGREALLGMFGIHTEQPPPPIPQADLQYVTCCMPACDGVVANNGRCVKCNIQFVAYIICPSCGWKQGVLNAEKYAFKCWCCEAEVADS